MNQAVSFGLLFGGGILLTSALTGSSLADVTKGHPGSVGTTGQQLSVAGVGQAISGALTKAGGYIDPFAQAHSVVPERIDQGQDFSLAPGSPILAPGDSLVLGVIPNWFAGQPYVAYQLLSGPHAGQNYYLAEQINPTTTTPGAIVKQGNPLAHFAAHGTGIEMGWAAQNWRQTLAGATTGYKEGQATAAGQSFHQFLADIGAIPGSVNSRGGVPGFTG